MDDEQELERELEQERERELEQELEQEQEQEQERELEQERERGTIMLDLDELEKRADAIGLDRATAGGKP